MGEDEPEAADAAKKEGPLPATISVATLPRSSIWDANVNATRSCGPKRCDCNWFFVCSTFLLCVAMSLSIVAAIFIDQLWCHNRGKKVCPTHPGVREMLFPAADNVKVKELVKIATDLNDLRELNPQINKKNLIVRGGKEEVCLTFEKFPGLYNKNAQPEGNFESTTIYYHVFFAQIMFSSSAVLAFFTIVFSTSEHHMIKRGGDDFENLYKCQLITDLLCGILTAIGVGLLLGGVGSINANFMDKILTDVCKYNLSGGMTMVVLPAAIAGVFFIIAAPLGFLMHRD